MAITINGFLSIIAAGLLAVYIFLRPMDIKQDLPKEIAQLELIHFSIQELNATTLRSVLKGDHGLRYKDRYEVQKVSFSDNTKEYLQHMHAGYGIYKDEILKLDNGVHFKREDGLSFTSNEAMFEQKRSIATTKGAFEIRYNDNWVKGKALYYDTKRNIVRSKEVEGVYMLEDKVQ